jgi:hypothetical protein
VPLGGVHGVYETVPSGPEVGAITPQLLPGAVLAGGLPPAWLPRPNPTSLQFGSWITHVAPTTGAVDGCFGPSEVAPAAVEAPTAATKSAVTEIAAASKARIGVRIEASFHLCTLTERASGLRWTLAGSTWFPVKDGGVGADASETALPQQEVLP